MESSYKVGDLCKLLHKTKEKHGQDDKKSKEDRKLESMFGNSVIQSKSVLSEPAIVQTEKKQKKSPKKSSENLTVKSGVVRHTNEHKKQKAKHSLETEHKDKSNNKKIQQCVEDNSDKGVKKKKTKVKGEEDQQTEDRKGSKKQKKKKHKLEPSPGSVAGFNPPPGIVHESLQNKHAMFDQVDEKESSAPAKKKRKRKLSDSDDEMETEDKMAANQPVSKESKKLKRLRKDRLHKDANPKTIFIGNLPLTVKKRKLTKMFKKFGAIESIRYRCLPPKNPKVPKKVTAIKKDFHPERHNCVAFIRFENEESAKKAVELNGELVDGLHIRVDTAEKKKTVDTKHTVFVGNIPFDMEEDLVRSHFQDCGTVDNVRIIRDPNYGIGKGFCYVKFVETDAVSLALKLNGSELSGRKLRVALCEANTAKKGKSKTGKGTKQTSEKRKHGPLKPSNMSKRIFQGEKARPRFKRKKKDMKKMRARFKEKQKQKRIAKNAALTTG